MNTEKIPLRKDVPQEYTWDLTQIYKTNAEWEADLAKIPTQVETLLSFKGRLSESEETLLAALQQNEVLYHLIEDVWHYANLLSETDQGDSAAQDKVKRAQMTCTNADASLSFFVPELLSIPDEAILSWIEKPAFEPYRIYVQKILHNKPHTLSEKEERILSLQYNSGITARNTFSLLNDVDLNFGTVTVNGKEKPLTHSTWSTFMEHQDRTIREKAYKQFYGTFEAHENTLASLYAGSVNNDVFLSRARGYTSSLDAALYGDKVPCEVYTNLIDTVHAYLEPLHRYYGLRAKILGQTELRHYDVSVPLVKSVKTNIPYEESVEIVRNALQPLGTEYTDILCNGLLHGWADRFENKGKHSGAFSSGAYRGYPYILLNYKSDSIRDVYTMAHEGGHSMHSWFSVHNNPFMCYDYTIFEAEVASTFNEQLVFQYLFKDAQQKGNKELAAYLLSSHVNDIIATLYRQTMFAEFELLAHQKVEQGIPLTTSSIRETYRELLTLYFGPIMNLESNSDLECLRIPHFYNAFYVYKYATGISASLALSKRVTNGGEREREDYFTFLKSGGSRYPIESLRLAGVDMQSPEPVKSALETFTELVKELETLL